jgi:Ca2+-binding RTX toxin-like protein
MGTYTGNGNQNIITPTALTGGATANPAGTKPGPGTDYIYGYGNKDTLDGGSGGDYLYGGADNDTLWGKGGSDKLWGEGGNDDLYGGAGNDDLYGGAGNDKLWGEGGNDKHYGGAGHDEVYGGLGNDTLYGEQGNDKLHGGAGQDKHYGGTGADTFYFGKTEGGDTIYEFKNEDTIELEGFDSGDNTNSGLPKPPDGKFSIVDEPGNKWTVWWNNDDAPDTYYKVEVWGDNPTGDIA